MHDRWTTPIDDSDDHDDGMLIMGSARGGWMGGDSMLPGVELYVCENTSGRCDGCEYLLV